MKKVGLIFSIAVVVACVLLYAFACTSLAQTVQTTQQKVNTKTNYETYVLKNGKMLIVKTTTPCIKVELPAHDTSFVQGTQSVKKVKESYTDCNNCTREYDKIVVGPPQAKVVKLKLAAKTVTVPVHKLDQKQYFTIDKPVVLSEATIVTLKYK